MGRFSAFASPFRRSAVLSMRNDKDGRGTYFVTQFLLLFTFWLDHFCVRSSPLCLAHWPPFFHSSFPFSFLLFRRRVSEVAALSLQREHILEAAVQVFVSSSKCNDECSQPLPTLIEATNPC